MVHIAKAILTALLSAAASAGRSDSSAANAVALHYIPASIINSDQDVCGFTPLQSSKYLISEKFYVISCEKLEKIVGSKRVKNLKSIMGQAEAKGKNALRSTMSKVSIFYPLDKNVEKRLAEAGKLHQNRKSCASGSGSSTCKSSR